MSANHFSTQDPATGKTLNSYTYLNEHEAKTLLQEIQLQASSWALSSLQDRALVLQAWAEALSKNKNLLAEIVNSEMGKPLSEGLLEVQKSADCCLYYAEVGPAALESQKISTSYSQSWISFQPLGTILAIMPWNFPIWQSIRCMAPAIMAGNCVVLKPAEITMGSQSLLIELLQNSYDLAQSIVGCVKINHATVEKLIQSECVQGVAFTGSVRAGRQVAALSGQALKKTVLELGGSDAYVVLTDADPFKAAQVCVQARMVNYGQSCVAAKRIIVTQNQKEIFLNNFLKHMQGIPMRPLAHVRFRDELHRQVQQLKNLGGQVLLGGVLPSGEGAFYPPTVIVLNQYVEFLRSEEVFGPVAVICEAPSDEIALQWANDCQLGLGGAIFTNQQKWIDWAEKKFQTGFVAINDMVRSDPRLPFGGVKNSGFGRELSLFGLYEFLNIKTIVVGHHGTP